MTNKPTHEKLQRRIKALEEESVAWNRAGKKAGGSAFFMNYLIDSLPYPFLVIDPDDYSILMANAAAMQDSSGGVTTCYALSHNRDVPCEGPEHRCPLKDIKKTGKPVIEEHIHLKKDGSSRTVTVHVFPVFDENKRIVMVIECIFDITELKQAEEALRKERDKAQLYLDIAGVMFIALNDKGKVTLINEKGCKLLGYSEEEIVGKNWFKKFLPEQVRDEVMLVFKKILSGESEIIEYYENPILTKSGKEKIIAWHNTILKNEEGRIKGLFASGEDITERKRAEDKLKKNELELENQARKLKEANIALKVLIDNKESEKTELEEKILANVKDLIMPFVKRLKTSRLDIQQNSCLGIIESNLEDIISPLANRLSSKFAGLTPAEIQVADLIKGGKTNKEISALLCVSKDTVKFHRGNIRKKLGLKNTQKNLKSYLMTLS